MKEFADFLGDQPPFDGLDAEDLARLASRIEVEYFAAGAQVVAPDERLDHLWVVRTGALEVLDRGRVIDLLGPGDLFGHVSLLSNRRRRVGPSGPAFDTADAFTTAEIFLFLATRLEARIATDPLSVRQLHAQSRLHRG